MTSLKADSDPDLFLKAILTNSKRYVMLMKTMCLSAIPMELLWTLAMSINMWSHGTIVIIDSCWRQLVGLLLTDGLEMLWYPKLLIRGHLYWTDL